MTRNITALEGLPCAGKTAFFNKFDQNHSNYVCIPELYIAASKNDSNIDIRKRYARAELLKKKKVGNLNLNILLDRSILSSMAFTYAKYKLTGDISDYAYNQHYVTKNWKKMLIPDNVILFEISPKESLRRRKILTRDDTFDLWSNLLFLQYFMSYYYSNDITNIIAKNRIAFVNTTRQSEDETYKIVLNKIDEFNKWLFVRNI